MGLLGLVAILVHPGCILCTSNEDKIRDIFQSLMGGGTLHGHYHPLHHGHQYHFPKSRNRPRSEEIDKHHRRIKSLGNKLGDIRQYHKENKKKVKKLHSKIKKVKKTNQDLVMELKKQKSLIEHQNEMIRNQNILIAKEAARIDKLESKHTKAYKQMPSSTDQGLFLCCFTVSFLPNSRNW